MDSEDERLSIGRIAGLTIDFLVIVVPIFLTAAVAAVITVALLPEFSIAVVGAGAILAAVRWLNCRDDEYRAKRYSQVPH
jgi:hypothetical protein